MDKGEGLKNYEIFYYLRVNLLNTNIMTDIPKCPKCNSEYTYFDGMLYVCPDCAHEFSADDTAEEAADVAKDSNGAQLFDGDAVTVIKDLKVKGSSMVIKRGTKVKSIRLTENPEEVDCKIDGSSIVLKTCFLKK
jgi:protein PhnA